ncbi:hypothetical protein [Psychrobacter sp. FDAARGOS_221]|uniref:hypothetical protein n=1 Tax=Psychrobacter sp. FDAARGOS_221 TaxID=1975705 RepID=UPI000BB599FA|nr:hypothetical protein [Psychrobacter sp. FDAARGOS_221]PNK59792.1 hypothetical protein A6J60_002100 [Psychrobacter sp. FDAARGOS_221]
MITPQMTDTSYSPTPNASAHVSNNTDAHTEVSTNSNTEVKADPALLTDPNTLHLDQIISDEQTPWQIHNCKIIDKTLTQDEKLPFIYHYDALSEEVKAAHPLTPDLLKQFQTPVYASEAADLLKLPAELIKTPWQVKVTGTLVMFCERLQLALRLKFTNTAKQRDPIYSNTPEDALKIALENWHFYGDIFVLNKGSRPLVMSLDDEWLQIPRSEDYQVLPAQYTLALLALLEEQKQQLPQLTEAIALRLA